jgi:hypothetical protein
MANGFADQVKVCADKLKARQQASPTQEASVASVDLGVTKCRLNGFV